MDVYKADPEKYETMKYRRCGKSGVLLPAISLGLWHNFGESNPANKAVEMLKYAFDQGITHFDLANNYGPPPGEAEKNFGRILKREFSTYRDEMIISSKAGHRMWDGPYGDGGSRKSMMASIDQSLKRLQTDYVDIFYSHRYDPNTPIEETMQALSDIIRQGKALYVGLSKYPIEQAHRAFRLLQKSGTPCLIYQDRYNLLTREAEAHHLETVQNCKIGFAAFSPLAQGLLSDKYLDGIPEHSRAARPDGFLKREQITPEIIQKVKQLQEIASKRNQSISQMALAWLLHDERVTSVIIGASSVAQLQNNLKSLDNIRFDESELAEVDKILRG